MATEAAGDESVISGLLPNRACRNCSHIKAKCIPQAGTKVCQRCHRLDKQCTTATPRKRQRTHASGPSLTPVSIQEQPTPTANGSHQEQTSRVGSSVNLNSLMNICRPAIQAETNVSNPVIAWASDPSINTYSTRHAVNLFNISPEIGHNFVDQVHETMFDHFRFNMSKHFPFLVFPQDRAPVEIAMDRPFLYSCCIMTACHQDPPMQTRISKDIIRYISERLLLSGEKNLDLLQGIILMTAWYHVYTHTQPQLMNLLHIAKALLVDLGLNRPFDASIYNLKVSNDASHQIHSSETSPNMHTPEQRRTCLAVYHAHTSFAYVFHRLDPVPWTVYLEECLKELEEHPEAESDRLMTATIRLYRIHEKYANEEINLCKSIPTRTYVKLFNEDLDTFRGSLSDFLKTNSSFLAQIHSVKISLLETAFMHTSGQTLQKVEAMHICLQTLNDFFQDFAAQPDEDYSNLPFLCWVKVAHALDVLAKLSFARLDGWDVDYVRTSPGFVSIVESLISQMMRLQAYEATNSPSSKDARFKMFANRLEKFKQWYEKNLELEAIAISQNLANGSGESNQVTDTSNTHSGLGDVGDFIWQDFMTLPNLENDFHFLN